MTVGPILSLRHYRDSLIAHSHEHPQLVFGLRGRLEFEVQGQGAGIDRQGLVVVPAGAHHTCASDGGSHCLVLDVPGEQWLAGDRASAGNRGISPFRQVPSSVRTGCCFAAGSGLPVAWRQRSCGRHWRNAAPRRSHRTNQSG